MSPCVADAATPAQVMELAHHFTRGIRFDTEVQHLQSGAKGQRWRNMPLTWPDLPDTPVMQDEPQAPTNADQPECGALCLAQCLTALAYPGMALVKERPPPDLGDAQSLNRWLQSQGLDLRSHALTSTQPEMSGALIGAYALDAIQSGATCAVCMESSNWLRWVWLAGVESVSKSNAISIPWPTQQARALLVLDSKGSPPWACGHNARIELSARGRSSKASRSSGPSIAGTPTPQLIYRHLSGQAAMVSLRCLVALRK